MRVLSPRACALGYDLAPLTGLRNGRPRGEGFISELLTQDTSVDLLCNSAPLQRLPSLQSVDFQSNSALQAFPRGFRASRRSRHRREAGLIVLQQTADLKVSATMIARLA